MAQIANISISGFLQFCKKEKKKFMTHKWPFYDHFWPFFSNYMNIFHKTEVPMVILSCLTCLNLNWIQSYVKKHDFFPFQSIYNFIKKSWRLMTQNSHFLTIFGHFFCQLHESLLQNWDSDSHFEELSMFIS